MEEDNSFLYLTQWKHYDFMVEIDKDWLLLQHMHQKKDVQKKHMLYENLKKQLHLIVTY
jgi:hypothetical protein